MKIFLSLLVFLFGISMISAETSIPPTDRGYIIVTNTIAADGVTDVADALQALIDANPQRTLYFPDGKYVLSHPIMTPAAPHLSVDLQLSNYAIIQPSDTWNSTEALIRLGGEKPFNDINANGSNYSLTGGIIDGKGIAKGISIDSGRETAIRNVSIKHTTVGIHIKHGANYGSSDADISNVNIVGANTKESIGVLIEGFDNTFTNMRIASVYIGMDIRSGGNSFRNIHPLFISMNECDYDNSVAFWDKCGGNWYDYCYSDQFGIGFRLAPNVKSIFDKCFVLWYGVFGNRQCAVMADGAFCSIFTNLRVGFNYQSPSQSNIILSEGAEDGHGVFDRMTYDRKTFEDKTHEKYLKDGYF